jgi:lipoyl(octanoyl) transferase
MLEEVMIRTCLDFGVEAGREVGKSGVWIAPATETSKDLGQRTPRAQSSQSGGAEKIGAIGVHISRWVTSHGFAFNVATDLRFFDLIVPCGIVGRAATSLEKVLGRRVERKEVEPNLARHFGDVFGLEMKTASREDLFDPLLRFEQPVAIPA